MVGNPNHGRLHYRCAASGDYVILSWNTLTAAAADEAGMSRRYGGIHFQSGDEHGRSLGKVIGYNDWNKALTYVNGTATSTR